MLELRIKNYVCLLWLLLPLLFFGCAEKKKELMPKIYTEHQTIDLGNVQALTQVKKSVLIFNTGTGVLEILKVEPSCGCTKTKLSSKKIESSKAAKLSFTFNAPNHDGETNNTICLRNNSKERFYLLSIKAKIFKP